MKRSDSGVRGQSYYQEAGDVYLAHRDSARSDYNQRLRASLFKDIASDELVTLDFGCGTGGILSNLPAGKRVGVELGEQAAAEARTKGIEVHSSLGQIPDESIDLAISFHAIEHVDHPLSVLEGVVRVLKRGGRARLVVPCQTPIRAVEREWRPNPDQHLYTWTPLLFGNLAARAGFSDVRAKLTPMPSGSRAARLLGTRLFPGRAWSTYINLRDNSYSVILDATR